MNDQQVSFIGQLLADRYLVERKLGQGGVGTAYRADDRRESRPVAVKIFNPGIEPGDPATELLLADARTAARLVSPNLMPTLDVGIHADRFAYVVEPLLAGRSLERRLEEDGPLAPANAVRVAIELLAALEVLHRADLLHLDIKPSNVFLVADPLGMERAVLSAVGTWHVLALDEAPAKATGTCLARPEYVTPEIVSGKPLDASSDVYLIGVLLYEMLTGRPPFPGTNQATARRHALEKPVSPKLVRPQARITDDLDALVDARAPRRRRGAASPPPPRSRGRWRRWRRPASRRG
ncbi:MAG: serine/threonine-protein kinase [bacterium]